MRIFLFLDPPHRVVLQTPKIIILHAIILNFVKKIKNNLLKKLL